MQILRNEVVQASNHSILGDSRYRILDINASSKAAILFQLDLFPRPRKPFVVGLDDLSDWQEKQAICRVDYETPQIMTLDDERIPKVKLEKRDGRYNLISSLISQPDFVWRFASNCRCKDVAEEAKSQSKLAITIYRVLHRYWEYGQCTNALLDNTANCGAPGQDRTRLKAVRGTQQAGSLYSKVEEESKC